jgi:hypothetical protein
MIISKLPKKVVTLYGISSYLLLSELAVTLKLAFFEGQMAVG